MTTTTTTSAIRRLGRHLGRMWTASLHMTAQERADAYVNRSPLSVIAG
ncbi:hypothetical protein ACX9NE_27455 [Mycobacterium sp. ML4]